MKFSFSLATTRGGLALWYWNELSEMIGVCAYDGIEIPFQAWSFNGGRGAAPVCAEAIRTKFGSVKNYDDFLRGCGIKEGLGGLHISAGNIISTMMEYNVPREKVYDRTLELAKETIEVLAEAGSTELVFSPSPMCAVFDRVFAGSDITEESYLEEMAKVVSSMGELAKASGIKLSLRNEFYGLLRGDKIVDFMDKVSDDVCYSPDLAQLHIAGADTEALIRKYAGRLGSVKLNDTFFVDTVGCYATRTPENPQVGENQRVYCSFGNGDVDIAGLFNTLVETGFDEWVVMESKNAFNVEKMIMRMQAYRKKSLDPILAERR